MYNVYEYYKFFLIHQNFVSNQKKSLVFLVLFDKLKKWTVMCFKQLGRNELLKIELEGVPKKLSFRFEYIMHLTIKKTISCSYDMSPMAT